MPRSRSVNNCSMRTIFIYQSSQKGLPVWTTCIVEASLFARSIIPKWTLRQPLKGRLQCWYLTSLNVNSPPISEMPTAMGGARGVGRHAVHPIIQAFYRGPRYLRYHACCIYMHCILASPTQSSHTDVSSSGND